MSKGKGDVTLTKKLLMLILTTAISLLVISSPFLPYDRHAVIAAEVIKADGNV